MNITKSLAIASTIMLLAPTALASDFDDQHSLALSWGTFGIADTEDLVQLDLEWRMPSSYLDLRPIFGASVLEDGGNYVYSGLRYDYEIDSNWSLSPSFAVGVYSPGEVDLGGPIEFRSGLDLSYQVTSNSRFGIGVSHMSNGGIYSRNGGSESLLMTYSVGL
ncbi:MAG: lipid A 3-O-deacylase [Bacteroidia bacterium]|jgi:lipid A 3-O-deacylase